MVPVDWWYADGEGVGGMGYGTGEMSVQSMGETQKDFCPISSGKYLTDILKILARPTFNIPRGTTHS